MQGSSAREALAGITIPQRLLIASAVVYGALFALLVEYGRPGLGIGEGFYELAIHERVGLAWPDFDHPPALVRLVAYVAAGVVTGFLARRLRLMLAQSLHLLEELSDLAYGRVDWASLERARRAQDASPDRV